MTGPGTGGGPGGRAQRQPAGIAAQAAGADARAEHELCRDRRRDGPPYKLRPRAAWRIAWGWTLEEAAERYNVLRAKDEDRALASLTGCRLSEWENWPFSTRKPPVTGLCLLAEIYHAGVLDLIDVHDREKLPAAELLTLGKLGTTPAPPAGPHGRAERPSAQMRAQPEQPADMLPWGAAGPAAADHDDPIGNRIFGTAVVPNAASLMIGEGQSPRLPAGTGLEWNHHPDRASLDS